MRNYPGFSMDELLLQMSFQQLIDMYVAIGKDYNDYILKKLPKKLSPYGNFTLPGVNVVKSKKPGKVEWTKV